MLPWVWRGLQRVGLGSSSHIDRLPDDVESADILVGDFRCDPEMGHLGLCKGLIDRVYRAARHAGIGHGCDPVRIGVGLDDVSYFG